MAIELKPCECTSTERCTGVPLPAGFYCRLRQEEADRYDDSEDDRFEDEEEEEADANCMGWFDQGVFVCGAVGSEDCDCCPNYSWLGKTSKQIDEDFEEKLGGT